MIIESKKLGTFLTSRPDGREAFYTIRSYFKQKNSNEKLILDFKDVEVVAPSWLDEVLTNLEIEYGPDQVELINNDNVSIQEALKVMKKG